MEKEDKHLDGSGLGRVWAKIKAQYLAKTGGTLTGKLTISSGGLEVTGDSRYHDSVVLDNNKGLIFKNTSDGNVTALSLNSQNVLAIGYGNASANQTQIFGKSIILATNGANTRMTIGEDGNTKFEGSVSIKSGNDYKTVWHAGNSNLATINWSCLNLTAFGTISAQGDISASSFTENGTLISTKYTYTAGDYISITNNAISVKEASTSQGGVVTTGAQTFGGTKNFRSSDEEPVILSFSSGGTGYKLGLKFMNGSTDLGAIGMRKYGADEYFYFRPGGTTTYNKVWHEGNANLLTVSWKCLDLTANGDISAVGNISSVGNVTAEGNVVASGGVAANGIVDMYLS